MKPIALLIQILLSGAFGFHAYADEPVLHTQNGDVRGKLDAQVESFKALPYAAPPVGSLRWMPPQEPANWSGIRDASSFSSECPQIKEFGEFVGKEDCLYLNVFKPSGASALPVIVFIHGGSNVRGSASQIENGVAVFDGSSLARNGNIVVVTLNYRLGTLGLIGHPGLSHTSGYGASGNYAYMDQIQALQWIQRNIAVFGGDPNNVTLFGQSAGAKSVWVHLTSPLSGGLFHRAIVDSAIREGARTLPDTEKVGKVLSQKLNCSNAPDEPAELACMRGKSAQEIVKAMPSGPGSGLYAAVVDGKVLTDFPIKIMRAGQHHHVPILEGNVEEEMSVLGFNASQGIHTEEEYKAAIENLVANIQGASAAALLSLYPRSEYASFPKAYNAIVTDKDYVCPARRILKALSASQTEFIGRFFYKHIYSNGPFAQFGASHGYEVPFIFDTLAAAEFTPTADERTLVKVFQDMWSSFARMGTPPASWTKYDAEKDNYVIFDTMMSESDHLRQKQCDHWDTLPPP